MTTRSIRNRRLRAVLVATTILGGCAFGDAPGDELPLPVDNPLVEDTAGFPPGGAVAVEGLVSAEGVECLALRDADDRLFTVVGQPAWMAAGQMVRVSGTVAEVSICQQGTTIEVAEAVRLDPEEDESGPVDSVPEVSP